MTDCDLNLTVIIDEDLKDSAAKDKEENLKDSESIVLLKNLEDYVDYNF